MPQVSRFLGIVIAMYYRDHAPPHFHALYGECELVVRIDDGVTEGRFPRRALGLVLEWYDLNKDSLEDNWDRARRGQSIRPIPPLE